MNVANSVNDNAAADRAVADAPAGISEMEKAAYSAIIAGSAQRQNRELEGRARQVMEAELYDPFSARFRNLRSGRNGSICGQVNGRNQMAAYVGFRDFVIERGATAALISARNDGVRTELSTGFASAYVSSCASREEIVAYRILTRPAETDRRFDDVSSCVSEASPLLSEDTDLFALCGCAVDRHYAGEERGDAMRQCARAQGVQLPRD